MFLSHKAQPYGRKFWSSNLINFHNTFLAPSQLLRTYFGMLLPVLMSLIFSSRHKKATLNKELEIITLKDSKSISKES